MINENFIYVGVLLTSIATISYLIDTLKGKVKPNRVSFFLWALAPMIAFFSEIKQGVGIQSLLTFFVGFWSVVIFLASFANKKAYWQITRFDIVCGVLSLFGLILWLVTKVGNVAIIFSIMADGLAALPTIRKSFHFPETENVWPYFAGVIYSAITLLTIKNWKLRQLWISHLSVDNKFYFVFLYPV
jgi:hypothetical protein